MSFGGTTSPSSLSSWTPFSSYYGRIITRSPFFTSTTTPACWISGGLLWTGYPAATVSVLTQLCPPVTQIFPATTFTVWLWRELNNSSALVSNPLDLKRACFPHKTFKVTKWHSYRPKHCCTLLLCNILFWDFSTKVVQKLWRCLTP